MYKSIVQSVQSWVFYILVGIVESFSGEKHLSLQEKNMYIVRPRRLRRVHQPELRRLGPGKFHYGYDVPNVIVDVSIQMVISGSQFVSLPEATARGYLQFSGWWFGCHLAYFPINIGFLIIPIDFHIFQRGSNHQPDFTVL